MIIEVDNKKVFFSDLGYEFDQNKKSIILLHGSGQSHTVWSLTDQFLADQGTNVFTIDFLILISFCEKFDSLETIIDTLLLGINSKVQKNTIIVSNPFVPPNTIPIILFTNFELFDKNSN